MSRNTLQIVLTVAAALSAFAVRVQAQYPSQNPLEIHPFAGALIANARGYGALGLDVDHTGGKVGLRVEVRDNVTGFKGVSGELQDRKTRNDLQFAAGLTFGF
jgi:hypothetical protein